MGNNNNLFGARPVYNLATGTASVPVYPRAFPTTSNTTIREGDFLVVDANGRLKPAGATSTALFAAAAHGVTAVTATPGSVKVYPAIPTTVFAMQALTATGTATLANITGHPAGVSSATYMGVDLAGTTSVLQVVGIDTNSTADASLAIVHVVVSKSSFMGIP